MLLVRSLFSLLFLLLVLSSSAQKAPIDPVIGGSSTATGQVRIPGTRLSLVPPAGFTAGTGFSGFQKGESSMIMVMDLKGGNYYTNAATFNGDAFASKGATVLDYREIRVGSFPGKFVWMQSEPGMKAVSLVFGDTTFSTMIMALYPANDEALAQQVFAAINSIRYNKTQELDPMESARFSLDASKSELKFLHAAANLYIYTPGGKDNKGTDLPFLLVTQLPGDESMTPESLARTQLAKAGEYGFGSPKMRSAKEVKINGKDGYEMELESTVKGKTAVLYICAVAGGDVSVIALGISYDGNKVDLFRELTQTLRFR